MVIVFICVHLQCALLRCSALEGDKGEDKISRVAVTIVDYYLYRSCCVVVQQTKASSPKLELSRIRFIPESLHQQISTTVSTWPWGLLLALILMPA